MYFLFFQHRIIHPHFSSLEITDLYLKIMQLGSQKHIYSIGIRGCTLITLYFASYTHTFTINRLSMELKMLDTLPTIANYSNFPVVGILLTTS